MPRRPTRLAICVHEAGHAIVQLAHGVDPWIDFIAVDDLPDGMLGRIETISIWQPWVLELPADREVHEAWSVAAWRDVVTYLAGPIAELRWRKCSRAALRLGADEMAQQCLHEDQEDVSDFGRVRRRLECAVPGADRANFMNAWLEAEEAVARWWQQITALGRMLEARGRIDDVELYAFWNRMRENAARPRSAGRGRILQQGHVRAGTGEPASHDDAELAGKKSGPNTRLVVVA